ncbi:MAG: ECF-type sigma factor [Verrucomicrobiota bacterium]
MKTFPDDDNGSSSRSEGSGGSAELLPLVYQELRRLAQSKMNQEAGPQTLTATALVHEAYLRVSKEDLTGQWANQRHFFGAAAEAMRRILIDRARAKKQLKRGGDREQVELSESQIISPVKDDKLLAVDEALELLEKEDPESAELAKLRYFAGMTWEEISEALGVPDRTVRRRWTYTKAWLQQRIESLREA